MPVIKISNFAGERPLINARLLPDTAAKAAFNTRLSDGALTPTHKAAPQATGAANNGDLTIYRNGDEWLSWPTVVSAVPGPVATDRLYFTGDGVPKMRVAGVSYPLAVPRPTVAPVATVSGTANPNSDIVSRTYVYTFVTSFGEESAPSPASTVVDWKPGQTLTLSGIAAAPAGRSITKQRFYRSQTGSKGTYLYLIAERDASASNFVDTIAPDKFNEALPSADWNAPPDGLSGLAPMTNGMMAGFVGSSIYFCEPFRPHAWPEKYIMTCDYNIVGLRAIGTVLVVMTEGKPYLLAGASPDTMQQQRLEQNLPCINARGIVDLGFAVCYPSPLGLVSVSSDGSISLATQQLFSKNDWLALSPSTIVAGEYDGTYAMFYDTLDAGGSRLAGCLMINVAASQFLVRSAETAAAVFHDVKRSALYFKRAGETMISQFDAPDAPPETLYWRSKEFWVNRPTNMGAIMIDLGLGLNVGSQSSIDAEKQRIKQANAAIIASGALKSSINDLALNEIALGDDMLLPFPDYGSISVSVFADGNLVRTISRAGVIERLPAGFEARCWEIAVSSSVQISQIIVGGTVDEVKNAA